MFVAALATVVMGSCTIPAHTAPAKLPEKLPLGAIVVLDPGHNGGGGDINRQVPNGRGGTKACNTSGTLSNTGYPEHAFTFDVANRVRDLLILRGVQVIMTRDSDDGVGPCVDERAAIGNRANAAAVVSIHGDGNDSPDTRGFHVAYSSPPLNDSQGEPSIRLASTLRDALAGAGFVPSNYVGSNGLNPRDDLAGLNLSERPAALIECANMRDPIEAAILSSPDGRQRYAEVIANGIVAYLG
jgi:N-acetylmuramoyl-L-alanine amidase